MTSLADIRLAAAQPTLAQLLEGQGVRLSFAKDEAIFFEGDGADSFYLVVSGAVRTTRILGDGRRQVLGFYFAGELIGLEPGKAHRFTAEAVDAVEVLAIRRSALKAFAGDAALDRALWEAAQQELARAQEHLVLVGRMTASERVAHFLKDLAERTGGPQVQLPMSRQDMADYLGLTIETVSRMLGQLQSAEIIRLTSCRRFSVQRWDALRHAAA
jgi:CRP/FNR family nitrogen fixation transcriptional regulator